MVLNLVLDEAKIMKTITEALSISSTEMHLKIDQEEGFRAQAKGSGSHILTDVHLDPGFFTVFEIENTLILHVDLISFGNFVKLARNDDSLQIKYDKDTEELLLILKSKNRLERKASLRLLDDESNQSGNDGEEYRFMNILGAKFHSNSTFDANYLIDAIKVATFGEGDVVVTHDVTGIKLVVSADYSNTTAEAKINYDEENFKNVEIMSGNIAGRGGNMVELPDKHTANYDLESLKNIPKTIKSGEEINFSMMNMGPLRIVSDIGDKGKIAVALSPIIRQ